MAYLTMQKQGGGRYTSIYATAATWGDVGGGRRGAVQERLYVGRLDAAGGRVRVSKGFAGGLAVDVGLEELRERARSAAGVAEVAVWLRGLCASAAGGDAARPSVELLPAGDLGTALVGLPHVLGGMAAATGLDRCLADAFGEEVGTALLYLAMHQVAQAEPLYLAKPWLDELWLPACLDGIDFTSPGLSRLMDAVGRREEDRQGFYAVWLAARRHPRALVYDTTSISTYAAALEAASFGHNRDGESLPQENLALVCDRADGMPLFCRLVPGSVPDVSTLDATARILRELGLRDCEFALDRGFYSNANIRDLMLAGHHFTLGARLSCKQAKGLLARHRAALDSPKCSFSHEGCGLRHVRDEWQVDMGRDGRGKPRPPRAVAAHVFLDPRRRADQCMALEEKLFALLDKAAGENSADFREARRWTAENAGHLARCLGSDKGADGRIVLRRLPRAIAARAANYGYQIVLCDAPDREPSRILSDYRSRDRAEKILDMLKNEDGQHRLRTGGQHVAEGRVFLAFLALALRAEVENRMRDAGLLKNVSVPEFLAEVAKIRAIRLPGGDRLLREVTKCQREWIQAVRLPPVTV